MGGDVNTHLRFAHEVVMVTSGVRFQSRDSRAGGMCACAVIAEGVDRNA
jgi:hypothetical protein